LYRNFCTNVILNYWLRLRLFYQKKIPIDYLIVIEWNSITHLWFKNKKKLKSLNPTQPGIQPIPISFPSGQPLPRLLLPRHLPQREPLGRQWRHSLDAIPERHPHAVNLGFKFKLNFDKDGGGWVKNRIKSQNSKKNRVKI